MNIDYNAVIEILKSFLNNEKIEILGISVGEERQVKDAIRNLLTAYEKEKNKDMSCDLTETRADHIDESTMLKQIKLKLQEKNIPIETLLAEFERLEDLEDDREMLKAELEKEKEKNKELTDKLEDCDLHYSKLYKFHNNNCVTKDRINQIIDELIKLYFEEDSYCFSGFMFNNKTFNSLNIKEEMTVIQLLKHLQRLLKQEEK